jgi:hypothetical protein
MKLKENVNKIHSELSDKYDVVIEEGNSREIGSFIQLSIKEGTKNIIAVISKNSLESNIFNWTYKSNPLDNNSDMIERNSSVNDFVSHVKDIFEKNRFDSEYLKNLD